MSIRNLYIILVIISAGCNSKQDKKVVPAGTADSNQKTVQSTTNGLNIEPGLQKTDSLEILYYDDPDGDSLRYSRFYTYFSSNDSSLVMTLINAFEESFDMLNAPRECRSEGKVYLYHGQDPIKTIYFSSRNDTCRYLYFIKDGNFLYFPMPDQVNKLLKEYKSKAIKP